MGQQTPRLLAFGSLRSVLGQTSWGRGQSLSLTHLAWGCGAPVSTLQCGHRPPPSSPAFLSKSQEAKTVVSPAAWLPPGAACLIPSQSRRERESARPPPPGRSALHPLPGHGVIMTLPLQPRGWGWEGSFPKKGGVRPQTHRNSDFLASLPKLCVISTLRPRTRSGEGGHRTAPRMALIASSGGRQILCFGFLTVTFPVWVSGASVRNPTAVPPAGRNIHPSADSGGHRWAEELRQRLGDRASRGLLHRR